MDFFQREACTERIGYKQHTLRARVGQFAADFRFVFAARVEAAQAGFQTAQGFLEAFLNGTAHRHYLAHRFHLRGQAVVCGREFFKCETRDFGYHIVDGRLERCRRAAAGNVVAQLVQRKADRQFGCYFGNREAGCFRGQRRRTAHARVHLNHNHLAVFRVHRKLHVRATRVHADFAQYRQRSVAHDLVFLVRQRLRRRNRNRVARMHAHRVEVFNRANDDAVVGLIAYHFHLVLFPAENGLLNQQLMRRRRIKTAFANRQKLIFVIGNAAARTAHGERRTNQGREADLFLRRQSFVHCVADKRFRARQADFFHRFFKAAAVFRLVNRVFGRTD